MLLIGNITMQKVSTLFSATKDGMQTENITEGISHLAGIDIILTSITISLVFHILF